MGLGRVMPRCPPCQGPESGHCQGVLTAFGPGPWDQDQPQGEGRPPMSNDGGYLVDLLLKLNGWNLLKLKLNVFSSRMGTRNFSTRESKGKDLFCANVFNF